jgi:hypothetical protein
VSDGVSLVTGCCAGVVEVKEAVAKHTFRSKDWGSGVVLMNLERNMWAASPHLHNVVAIVLLCTTSTRTEAVG